jgi:uncharacterized protein YuzB (UPF0349 family)
MNIMLYDGQYNLDDCMKIVFGCLAYCDTCLPEYHRVIE